MKHFSSNNVLVAGIALVLLAVTLILLVSMRPSQRVRASVQLVDHTKEVIGRIPHIILTSTAIAELQHPVAGNSCQLQWADGLKTAIIQRVFFPDSMVQVRKQSGLPAMLRYSAKAAVPATSVHSRENGHAAYCSRDSGVGFDMKHVEKLFDVFHPFIFVLRSRMEPLMIKINILLCIYYLF